MKTILFLAIFAVMYSHTVGDPCRDCRDTYNNGGKNCTDIMAYTKCIFEAASDDCFNSADSYLRTGDRDRANVAPCEFVDTCKCQVERAMAAISSNPEECRANLAELECLLGTSQTGCDEVKTNIQLLKESETKAKNKRSCSLSATCQCQVDRGKSDMSTNQKKCDAYKAELACYINTPDTTSCNGSPFNDTVLFAKQKAIAAVADCLSETCKCHVLYFTNDRSTSELNCAAITAVKACVTAISDANEFSCDGSTTRSNVVTYIDDKATSLNCTGISTEDAGKIQSEVDVSGISTEDGGTILSAVDVTGMSVEDTGSGSNVIRLSKFAAVAMVILWKTI
ncbi:uncharacterized protein LOC121381191 isoform X2 [Gigantopelta aegis]|uniref:uncharacterized protein LOC121381191 isoform X2 n=1 Tax=Gigantopelta aegis TaxID=1735272 RepID=UPI001B88AC1A|nr:uncharacterized protein LOC121381191 isoform X2 [Gigantopelta aegis]